MNDTELFDRLFYGGKYSLPILIRFTRSGHLDCLDTTATPSLGNPDIGALGDPDITLTNNNEDVAFEGAVYKAAMFEYTPADDMGKGASLRICAVGNSLVEFVDTADDTLRLDVVAAMVGECPACGGVYRTIAEGGTVTPLRRASHYMGKVSWSGNMEMNFDLGQDDRITMTFPPYKFDTDTNRGNV